MGNALPVLLLLVFVAVEALATGKPIFYDLGYSLLGIVLLSFVWAWSNVNWVQLDRETLSPHTQVGQAAEERFLLRNKGWLPKLWLEVRDHSDLPGHRAGIVVASLGPGRQRGWTVRTNCLRRGRYRLGPLTLISSDPFGLFVKRHRLRATSSIVVYPLMVELAHWGGMAGELIGRRARQRRTHYVTTNVAGVREYYPGDTFNRIHWPSTARKDKLIVKEFELDPAADVWLFVDLQRSVQAEIPSSPAPYGAHGTMPLPALAPATEEYVVAVAATLARHLIDRQRAVGLVAQAEHRIVVQPERGERQLTKLLETLAVVRARGQVSLCQLLSSEGAALQRGSVAVVITPSADISWVQALRDVGRRGVGGVAVVIDAGSFGAPVGPGSVLSAVADAGLPGYQVRRDEPLDAALTSPARLS
ncbi:MAG: DUF58 domain-containing protein [Anaerolineae bacterium]